MSTITSLQIGQNKIEVQPKITSYVTIPFDLSNTDQAGDSYKEFTAQYTGFIYVQGALHALGRFTLFNNTLNLRSDANSASGQEGWGQTNTIYCNAGDSIRVEASKIYTGTSITLRNYY